MPSSNTPLLNLSLLIDMTFSTPTPGFNQLGVTITHRLSRGIHAAAVVAMLLTARQRCSTITIVTPYTPTMTPGMTTNR